MASRGTNACQGAEVRLVMPGSKLDWRPVFIAFRAQFDRVKGCGVRSSLALPTLPQEGLDELDGHALACSLQGGPE